VLKLSSDVSECEPLLSGRAVPMPLWGGVVRANAEWIMHGDPLGVKLHVPLARGLGAAALSLVEVGSGR